MKICYIFESGRTVTSNPHCTTGEMFAKQVAKQLAELDKIIDIKFILEEIY